MVGKEKGIEMKTEKVLRNYLALVDDVAWLLFYFPAAPWEGRYPVSSDT